MELLSLLLAFSAILLSLVYLIRRQYSYWQRIGAPYLPPKIPFGNLKDSGGRLHPCLMLQKVYNNFKDKAPFVGLYFFFQPAALIVNLDLIKQVLIKDFQYFNNRGHYYNEKDDPISAHLFALHGEQWRRLRTKLTPTYTTGKMKFMFPTVVDVGYRFQKRLLELSQSDSIVDMKQLFGQYTTDVIGTTAFGIECNTLNGLNQKFSRMGRKIFEQPRHNVYTRLLLVPLAKYANKLGIKMQTDDTSEFFTDIMKDTIRIRDENLVERNDFLNLLLEMRKSESNPDGLTINEIIAEEFLFFAAGFETSSSLQTFCMYELAANKLLQDKTRKHIRDVLDAHNGKFTYEALTDMKYLEQVLNETLRKFPQVPTLTRIADRDYKVPGTDFVWKKGTFATIPVYAIHHDPKYYKNPDEFNPENFSPENVQKRSPMAFLPFGEGPRICIGMRFGMMQAKIGVALALIKFEFEPAPNTKYPPELSSKTFTLVVNGGVSLNVKCVA